MEGRLQRRRIAKGGPVSRIPPSFETAIDRALRAAAEREERGPVFIPHVGTMFDSKEEGYDFFNMYSWEIGFGIRYGRSRTNSANYRTRQDIICACSGPVADSQDGSQCTGCMAMIRLLRSEDHGWYVSRFVSAHNHSLSTGSGETRQWNSHSRIDPVARDFIGRLRSNNISLSRLHDVIGGAIGYGPGAPFTKTSLRGLCARLSQDSISGDMTKTMSVLNNMQRLDPNLSVCIDTDEAGRVRSVLWCNGKNKEDYIHFGDVVTFDTTYRINLYSMPFCLFVGANNHFQSTIFAAVLVTSETTESFEWVFSTFLNVMNGKCPLTILTDQCAAMAATLKTKMEKTRHSWCRWHVLRKAKEKLGHVYSKFSGFKKQFHSLITDVMDISEFESKWEALVTKYKLRDNMYLQRLYDYRNMWAKPYFEGVFCAGMTSTQHSESANHMLKVFIPRSAPMHLFVTQYNAMLRCREGNEDKENHVTKQKKRNIRIGVPIEWSAAAIYTRTMFDKFSNELYNSGSFVIEASADENKVIVREADHESGNSVKTMHIVEINDSEKIYKCDCGLFEHIGMPCRHVLKVLVHNGITKLPESLVMKRWTISAKDASSGTSEVYNPLLGLDDAATRKNLLYLAAMDLLAHGSMNAQSFDTSMRAIQEAKHSVRIINKFAICESETVNTTKEIGSEISVSNVDDSTAVTVKNILPPPSVKPAGRPATTRLKSRADYYGSRSKKTKLIAELYEDDLPSKLQLSPTDISNDGASKKNGACNLCGVHGHNRRTCGRKKAMK